MSIVQTILTELGTYFYFISLLGDNIKPLRTRTLHESVLVLNTAINKFKMETRDISLQSVLLQYYKKLACTVAGSLYVIEILASYLKFTELGNFHSEFFSEK